MDRRESIYGSFREPLWMGIIEGHNGCAIYTTTIRIEGHYIRKLYRHHYIGASLYRGITI